jgi:ABC-type dipeptide/oligopeptide/nickel transport system ATPase component
VLGVVGETGAGKSLTALALLGMLRLPAMVTAGRIRFEGQGLAALERGGRDHIRGTRLTLIPQFASRCPAAIPACTEARPPAVPLGGEHAAACIRIPDGGNVLRN